MLCPFCRQTETKVIDSRASEEFVIRRRRECLNRKCGRRFTTYEKIEEAPLKVIKKDGSRVPFSRATRARLPELIKGVRICKQAYAKYEEDFVERSDPNGKKYFWLTGECPAPEWRADIFRGTAHCIKRATGIMHTSDE
jgi:hypothetical protein